MAEDEGMQISLHPDDPPWGLLGILIVTISIIIILIISAKSSDWRQRLLHVNIFKATASFVSNIILFSPF